MDKNKQYTVRFPGAPSSPFGFRSNLWRLRKRMLVKIDARVRLS